MYNWHHRKILRLKDYDYSQNWFYFVTICTKEKEDFFWKIIDWEMIFSDYGKLHIIFGMKLQNIMKM